MKLYEIKNPCKVKLLETPITPVGALFLEEGDVLNFYHIDGMYSFCKNKEGDIVHIGAATKVEIIK